MAKSYRDVAIEQMIATVEEAMSGVIDWWGKLPVPMNEAIENFRVQLGGAIDSVEFVKGRSTGLLPKRSTEKAADAGSIVAAESQAWPRRAVCSGA